MMSLATLTTFLPAAGLIGLALYQAVNQHDFTSAAHTVGQALTLFGIGTVGGKVLAVHAAVAAGPVAQPKNFQV
jgi:hypothetical protein